jgi:hypothetical protein
MASSCLFATPLLTNSFEGSDRFIPYLVEHHVTISFSTYKILIFYHENVNITDSRTSAVEVTIKNPYMRCDNRFSKNINLLYRQYFLKCKTARLWPQNLYLPSSFMLIKHGTIRVGRVIGRLSQTY